MRAVEPVESGQLSMHGFQVSYEAYGRHGAPVVVLLPTWQIVHSRIWRMQVPYLARTHRVIAWDAPGNGGGERTLDPAAVEYDRLVAQTIGLLDHLGVTDASLIGYSRGCWLGMTIAASYPERVNRLILIGNGLSQDPRPFPPSQFWERRESYSGWEKLNGHYWREQYPDWLEFFFQELFAEPHSTRQIELGITWGKETSPEFLSLTMANPAMFPTLLLDDAIGRIRCPVLLIHGDADRVADVEFSRTLVAKRPDWELVEMQGCGHGPLLRDPVRTNLLIAGFLGRNPARDRELEARHARA